MSDHEPLLKQEDTSEDTDNQSRDESQQSDHENSKKTFLGVFLLLLVVILWVLSSEATSHLFKNMKYEKPYMSCYVKMSLFSFYLLGFLFYPPWRRQCITCVCDDYPGQYQLLGEVDTDTDDGYDYQIKDSLSKSFFISANLPEDSGDDLTVNKKVQFNDVVEVRHLEDTTASYIARLNYGSSVRAKLLLKQGSGQYTIQQTLRLSFFFSLLFFLGNISYQEALNASPVAVVNIFTTTSSLFTLVLSALFPAARNDHFSFSKLVAVLLSISGLVLVVVGSGGTDFSTYFTSTALSRGVVWSLLGAFCYSLYLVLFKKCVGSESNIDIPMFFGFVGLFTMCFLWPGLVLFHYTGIEKFELPNKIEVMYLVVNGFIGTVLSELLWLWGSMLTSSLYATVSLSLTIPLSIFVDIIFRGLTYSWMFYVGVVPVFISVVAIGIFSHKPSCDPIQKILSCFSSKPNTFNKNRKKSL